MNHRVVFAAVDGMDIVDRMNGQVTILSILWCICRHRDTTFSGGQSIDNIRRLRRHHNSHDSRYPSGVASLCAVPSGSTQEAANMYSLQKYAGSSSRHTCPACGRPRCFTYYVDEEGEPLDATVGKCDHDSSCHYHKTPAEFFREHSERKPGPDWRWWKSINGAKNS